MKKVNHLSQLLNWILSLDVNPLAKLNYIADMIDSYDYDGYSDYGLQEIKDEIRMYIYDLDHPDHEGDYDENEINKIKVS